MQKDTKPKIILTGGHLSPLIAIYEVLKTKADLVVAGRKYTFESDKTISLEYKIFTERKLPFYDVNAGRLQRKFTAKTISSILKTPISLLKSIKIIKSEKPDAVLTFGGYVGFPIAVAAYISGVPVVLHEQTQKVGLTNKLIGKFAKKVCISFPSSEKYFNPKKTVITGNPVRREVFVQKTDLDLPKNEKVLLVMGGSTGSHNINGYIELLLPKLLGNFIVVHQTGEAREFKDYERLLTTRSSLVEKLRSRYILKKFISPFEIGSYYGRADVVVSRSGVNTVLELIDLKKKAVLIPLAYGQRNEQLDNAKFYKKSGLGTYIEEKSLSLGVLFNEILALSSKSVSTNLGIADYSENAAKKISKITLFAAKHE